MGQTRLQSRPQLVLLSIRHAVTSPIHRALIERAVGQNGADDHNATLQHQAHMQLR